MADDNKGEGGEGGKGTGTGGTGEGGNAPPPPVKAGAAGTPPPAPPAKPEGSKAHEIGVDDDVPDTAQLLSLTPQALNKRLDRFSKRQLQEAFGHSDMGKIKTDLADLATLRAEKEERDRAAMTESQRKEDDIRREKDRADKAEAKASLLEQQQAFGTWNRQADSAMAEFIDPACMRVAAVELRAHVKELSDAELKAWDKDFPKKSGEWAKEWATANPRFAKETAPPAGGNEQPPPLIKPLQTGPKVNNIPAPDPNNGAGAQKTARPGQPNSMSRKEFQALKKAQGISS